MITVTNPLIILWIILTISLIISGCYFLILSQKAKDEPDRRRIMFLIFFMFIFMGLSRFFHLITILVNGSFYAEFGPEAQLYFTISQICLYIGFITIINSFERKIKRWNKTYFTYILIIIAAVYFTFRHIAIFNKGNPDLANLDRISSYALNGALGLFGLYLSSIYLNISLKTSGIVKKKALLVFAGFLLLLASFVVFVLEDFLISKELVGLISFILLMISIPFLILGYR